MTEETASATEKDVKTDSSTEKSADVKDSSTHDEKGVPWKNRAMEAERYKQAAEEYRQKYEEAVSRETNEEAPDKKEKLTQEQLKEFVSDPEGFLERRLAAREIQRELPKALEWLAGQEGYSKKEDEGRITEIVREHGLVNIPSPMARAKAAWAILKSEKLSADAEASRAEKTRKDKVKDSTSDGTGKSASVKDGPKRADLLRALHKAEKAGKTHEANAILLQLEDAQE